MEASHSSISLQPVPASSRAQPSAHWHSKEPSVLMHVAGSLHGLSSHSLISSQTFSELTLNPSSHSTAEVPLVYQYSLNSYKSIISFSFDKKSLSLEKLQKLVIFHRFEFSRLIENFFFDEISNAKENVTE